MLLTVPRKALNQIPQEIMKTAVDRQFPDKQTGFLEYADHGQTNCYREEGREKILGQ